MVIVCAVSDGYYLPALLTLLYASRLLFRSLSLSLSLSLVPLSFLLLTLYLARSLTATAL